MHRLRGGSIFLTYLVLRNLRSESREEYVCLGMFSASFSSSLKKKRDASPRPSSLPLLHQRKKN